MLLVNCICTNMLNVAIHNCTKAVKGVLECIFIKWLIDYLSIIKILFDIVSRAVEAYIRELKPTARTNKRKIKYSEIRFLAIVVNTYNIAIAIARQKSSSAVHILLCKILEGEVAYVQ